MIKIATRGSKLALWQANLVASKLAQPYEICVIKTTGDIKAEESLKALGGKEVFTKEIDEALLTGAADIAVHSLKDVPGIIHPDLQIIACLERADARDVLLGSLKPNAVVGTSSPRRMAQILALEPSAKCIEFRGNVETRLSKLAAGQVDCTILAMAGISRLGIALDVPHKIIEVSQLTPAVGQGIICLMARRGSQLNLAHLNHELSFIAATTERAVLTAFGGNCHTPVAAHAVVGSNVTLTGFVAKTDGKTNYTKTVSGPAKDAQNLGLELGKELLYWFEK
jgi:hydroxymethylbilane synthase